LGKSNICPVGATSQTLLKLVPFGPKAPCLDSFPNPAANINPAVRNKPLATAERGAGAYPGELRATTPEPPDYDAFREDQKKELGKKPGASNLFKLSLIILEIPFSLL
jgi:hypothetical protein